MPPPLPFVILVCLPSPAAPSSSCPLLFLLLLLHPLPSPCAPSSPFSSTFPLPNSFFFVPPSPPPSQAQNQLVQFAGSAHVYSPYPIKTQSTTVTLPNTNIESFSRVSPVNKNEKEITYGPYSDLPAFSQAKMVVHFENNGPFIGVVSLERIIEVSHWGNIAVEEHVHIKHIGVCVSGEGGCVSVSGGGGCVSVCVCGGRRGPVCETEEIQKEHG